LVAVNEVAAYQDPVTKPTDRAKAASVLEGRWEVTELTRGDVATKILPEEDMTGFVIFDRDRLRFQIESFGYVDQRMSATFEVDGSRTPNRIDLTFTSGPNAGKSAKGIYELSGDELRICMPAAEPFDVRPTNFTVADGMPVMLFVMHRSK
jgi:uncharacterized protein (TIGR03067 family)